MKLIEPEILKHSELKSPKVRFNTWGVFPKSVDANAVNNLYDWDYAVVMQVFTKTIV